MDCSTSEGEQLLSEDEPEPEPAWNPATAMEAKQKGNEFYKQQKYYDAIDCYTKAIGTPGRPSPVHHPLASLVPVAPTKGCSSGVPGFRDRASALG